MDAGVLATVLLIAGLFLIALELMIPSFGIIGIAAFVCLVISLWSAGQAWWGTAPGFFWTFTVFLVLGVPGVMGGMLFLLQSTPLGKRVVLQAQKKENLTPLTRVRDELADLVGQFGKASALLSPGGMVEVDGRRYHAESVGMMVDPGATIVVVAVRGTRVVVRPLSEEEELSASNSAEKQKMPSSDSQIPAFLPEPSDRDEEASNQLNSRDSKSNGSNGARQDSPDTVAKSEETKDDILDFQIPE